MSNLSSLCVYCGSSNDGAPSHRDMATELGTLMAQRKIALVYGGGGVGLMGTIADAVMAGGGQVTGIIPDFLMHQEVGHSAISSLEVVGSMHERKARMAELSDGFLILPGGLGTLEEFFEMLTWRKLQLHNKPIAVLNQDGFWNGLQALIGDLAEAKYARATDMALTSWVENPEAALDALEQQASASGELASERL
jgi:uncharacterized protein (TIGR00730 family)